MTVASLRSILDTCNPLDLVEIISFDIVEGEKGKRIVNTQCQPCVVASVQREKRRLVLGTQIIPFVEQQQEEKGTHANT